MQCPFCKDEAGEHLQCIQTVLPADQRLDRILVRTGQWECDQCGFTKPTYAKKPMSEIRSYAISCHCCNDTGAVHHRFVRATIMPDYSSSDPPVPCRRCGAGLKIAHGWDIATKADCEQIHNEEISKIKFCPEPEAEKVQTAIRTAIKSVIKSI